MVKFAPVRPLMVRDGRAIIDVRSGAASLL